MIAGPDVTAFTMRRAIASLAALRSAHEIDPSISKETQRVLLAEGKTLDAQATAVREAERALEDYDLGDGTLFQARVLLGDSVRDDGVRRGNAKTTLALQDARGLDASRVFGRNVNDLTDEKLALEPKRVLEAVGRCDDVAEFPEKKEIVKDLTARAGSSRASSTTATPGRRVARSLPVRCAPSPTPPTRSRW